MSSRATTDDGICDKDECDFNSFRMGDTTFYGPGETVDTSKAVTVVTQVPYIISKFNNGRLMNLS